MLKLDIRPGDELKIGDATLRVVKKSGQLISVAIDAPKSVTIRKQSAEDAANQRKTHISSP
ncbi:CsrA-like regulator [Serratia phage Parlo]|uniref:CsrA-like regulator protein n=1 Tax=Serratia phage Parlo TaxID=2557554 RepID=A0A482MFL5_9CAUD|nr:CsrA-like regulator [Serratia phage Parlo]QBQ72211.1 CsrA-like regulator protein [Serratia phage Parlo]HEJ7283125.1 carbon storage regulator [Serratia marcescens]